MQDIPIFGIHAVEELLALREQDIEHVYFDKDKRSGQLFNLLRICRRDRLPYNLVPEAKLNALSGTSKHQGVVAFCSVRPYNTAEDLEKIVATKPAPFILLAASMEDPGNLGAIIRTCVCFGVDALLLERKNTVPLNATVAKTSAGMLEHICVVKPRNLEGLILDLVSKGFIAVGAVAEGGESPDKFNFKRPTVLIIGGEHRGIPPYLQKICGNSAVSIPMAMAQKGLSLNASVAAATLIYECFRQRHL